MNKGCVMQRTTTLRTAKTRAGLRLWLWWVLANALGFSFGTLLAVVSTDAFLLAVPETTGSLVRGVLHGGVLGLAQWLIVRRRLPAARWWILATMVSSSMIAFMGLAAVVLGGLALGLAQWLVLRRHVAHAGSWILASLMAWLIGWNVGGNLGYDLFNLVVADQTTYSTIEFAIPSAIGNAVGGAIYGAITGVILTRLVGTAASANL